jgi:hypothetical protein
VYSAIYVRFYFSDFFQVQRIAENYRAKSELYLR